MHEEAGAYRGTPNDVAAAAEEERRKARMR